MGRLLEMMERGTLVDKPSSDLMLRIMRGQLYRTRIPRYVTGYTIPHKTGDFLPYVGDDVGDARGAGPDDHPHACSRAIISDPVKRSKTRSVSSPRTSQIISLTDLTGRLKA